MNYDLVIKSGNIIDGTGKPAYKNDLGILNGRIETVDQINTNESKNIIDAKGLIVSPGFIDPHSHSDWTILLHPSGDSKVMQGVTTELNGLCGYASAPINKEEWWKLLYVRMTVGWSMHYSAAAYNSWPLPYGKEIDVDWNSMEEYLGRVEETGIGINYAMLFGHGAVRYYVMGLEARAAKPDEIDKMKTIAEKCMQEGALGMSAGLSGCPGCWASTNELIDLCKTVAKYDGIYMPHQRSSRNAVHINETIKIAEATGCRTCMSHTRLDDETKKIVDACRAKGVDITFDYFPYPGSIAGNIVYMLPHWLSRHRENGFDYVIKQLEKPEVREHFKKYDYPKWIATRLSIPGSYQHVHTEGEKTKGGLQQGGSTEPDWGHMQLQKVWTNKNKKFIGKTFKEIAEEKNMDPWTCWFDIICEEKGYARWLNMYTDDLDDMYNEEFEYQLKLPYGCIESDGPLQSPRGVTVTSADPRAYGTFPLVLGEYVRKRNVISWEEAIKKMTYNSAQIMGLSDRGKIEEGLWADIVIFDPNTIEHKATFRNTLELSQGINHDVYPKGIINVIVNGQIAVEKGMLKGTKSGKVLRNNK